MPKALVTGGAGFIGSHLVDRLMTDGWNVTVIDDLSTGNLDNLNLWRGNPLLCVWPHCVTRTIVADCFALEMDYVFHLAGVVGVRRVLSMPTETIRVAVSGTAIPLSRLALYGTVKGVFVASSSEVYGFGATGVLSESAPIILESPHDPRMSYPLGKVAAEAIALDYACHGFPVVIGRLFNTVGPRQVPDHGMVLPNFVHRAIRGEPLVVYGDGSQSRCFCAVDDVVDAIIRLTVSGAGNGRIVNVGSTEQVTILELAERVIRLSGSASEIRFISRADAYGQEVRDFVGRVPDLSLINRLIGWTPTTPLDDVIRSVIEHERKSLRGHPGPERIASHCGRGAAVPAVG